MGTSSARLFQLADDTVTMQGSVIRGRYLTHRDKFAEFNEVKFHAEYHNDIAKKISNAVATLSDAFILKSQALATSRVDETSKELEKSLNKVRFVVKLRFSGVKKIMGEFRFNKLAEIAPHADKFIGYSKDVLIMIEKYKAELIDEGLKADLIMDINGLIEDLDNRRREQIEAIASRPVHTTNRIDTMNELWKALVEIRDAANITFADQPEIRALFQLPKQSRSSSEEESGEVSEDLILDSSEEGSGE